MVLCVGAGLISQIPFHPEDFDSAAQADHNLSILAGDCFVQIQTLLGAVPFEPQDFG